MTWIASFAKVLLCHPVNGIKDMRRMHLSLERHCWRPGWCSRRSHVPHYIWALPTPPKLYLQELPQLLTIKWLSNPECVCLGKDKSLRIYKGMLLDTTEIFRLCPQMSRQCRRGRHASGTCRKGFLLTSRPWLTLPYICFVKLRGS